MNQIGKISLRNIKTLITGSSCRLGNSLSKYLINKQSTVYSIDLNILSEKRYGEKHFFQLGDVSDEKFFKDYLNKLPPIDALVNCAGFRSPYNYFLSYLVSKNILEKFKQNPINEYGCRGCIINLVFTGITPNEAYFKEQDEFIEKHQICAEEIDDAVYQLAESLTAQRIRCNTFKIDAKLDDKVFNTIAEHVISDQYVAGQIIDLEDNLRYQEITNEEFEREIDLFIQTKKQIPNQKYHPPLEIEDGKSLPLLDTPGKPNLT
ncbi:secreted protein [Sarcoptes scabiei]|nr:secreted protein [Sarcoptes scabiei]